ncbi:MAG: hypothetical protein IPJ65_21900 [Archangiaceae bacterium]|nr:hypothetical protein [Archangiaceae bacterium]
MTVNLTPKAMAYLKVSGGGGLVGANPNDMARMARAWDALGPADHRAFRQLGASRMGQLAKQQQASSNPLERESGRLIAESLKKGILPSPGIGLPPVRIDSGEAVGTAGMMSAGWGPK